MNVQHAVVPALDEARRHQPHEACAGDEVDAEGAQRRVELGLEGFALLEVLVIDDPRLQPRSCRLEQPFGLGAVGEDAGDLGGIVGCTRRCNQR